MGWVSLFDCDQRRFHLLQVLAPLFDGRLRASVSVVKMSGEMLGVCFLQLGPDLIQSWSVLDEGVAGVFSDQDGHTFVAIGYNPDLSSTSGYDSSFDEVAGGLLHAAHRAHHVLLAKGHWVTLDEEQ